MTPIRFAVALGLLAGAAHAHEFVLAPEATVAAVGAAVPFAAHSTHVFFAPEEAEGLDSVSAAVVAGGETRPVTLENAGTWLAGAAPIPAAGPVWLTGHRHGQVWSQTPDGWKIGGRDANPDARAAAKYEKFSKALLNAGGAGYDAVLGHLLEIVPLADPAALKAGDALPVKVLYDGAAIPATVHATFDGFADTPSTYAFVTETLAEGENAGTAMVRTWAPGLWVIRAEHDAPGGEGFDRHNLRATLVIDVRG
jgi:uncharacterized GH25 family protein